MDYILLNKSVYFTKEKILVFGDLHLGYEYMLKDAGQQFPQMQLKQTFIEIENTIIEIKKKYKKINKIVFLGDIKHYFAFNKGERNLVLNLLDILQNYVKREDIILIKGNHEKMNIINDKDFLLFYKFKNICFIHGDKEIKEAFDKKIKYICMGHLHPAISLSDNQKIRKEKYKIFLIGKYKSKEIIILPSFIPFIPGSNVNEDYSDDKCFIPHKKLNNFKVIVTENNKLLDFGKISKLSL